MNTKPLPKMDRTISKFTIALIKIYVTVILTPLTWVLKKLGLETWLLAKIGKKQMGSGGAEIVFDGYEPNKHDVFVSTFSKSGTNWMMQIAHQVAFQGKGEFDHIHDVVPWPDFGGVMKNKISIPIEDQLVQQASPNHLRVIKTHLGAVHFPYNEDAHYLSVLRDPKEVFVSSFYFAHDSFGPLMTDIDSWFKLFFKKEFPFNFGSTWAEHTASYWALREKPNVLVLSYQEMKDDLAGSIIKVADSLGVQLSESELEQVIEKSSFSYMSKINHKFQPFPDGAIPWIENFTMMRQGKSGNSKELITLEQQIQIDQHCQNELKMLGSDFPYAEYFQLAQ